MLVVVFSAVIIDLTMSISESLLCLDQRGQSMVVPGEESDSATIHLGVDA